MASFPCFKCNGKGSLECFNHVASGVCFQCEGTGRLLSKAERLARKNEAAAKEQRRRDAFETRMAREFGMTLEQFRAHTHPKSA